MVDASLVPTEKNEVEISIIEAQTDWPSVTAAALLYGTVFRIRGKQIVRAVLRRHRINRHGALKYRRPQIEDISQTLSTFIEEFERLSKLFNETTDVIQKRFREGRHGQNLTVPEEVTAAPKELLSEAQMPPLVQTPRPGLEGHTNVRKTYITQLVGSEEEQPCKKYDDLERAYADAAKAAAGDVERVLITNTTAMIIGPLWWLLALAG